jgi:hypothetical protein
MHAYVWMSTNLCLGVYMYVHIREEYISGTISNSGIRQ